MISAVATRYAKAMVEVVTAPNSSTQPGTVLEQLRAFQALVKSSSDLHHVLLSPAVPPSRKRAVVGRLVDPLGLSHEVRNFLFVLIDRRRMGEIENVIEAFELLLDEALGFVRADVTSARELSEAQRLRLEGELSRLTGRRARPRFSVDDALIAGVMAKVGSAIYDGSVRGQLDAMKRRLRG